ncbi:hypothetical protein ND747_15830, partial [Frankia sp. R82]|nr:hypothetical protein [Frankia sp. R82]
MDSAQRTLASRRRVLAGLGTIALAGITGSACSRTGSSSDPATGHTLSAADVAAARAAVARARALATSYTVAARRHPSQRALFDTLRAQHEVALATVSAQVPAAAPASPPAAGAAQVAGQAATGPSA